MQRHLTLNTSYFQSYFWKKKNHGKNRDSTIAPLTLCVCVCVCVCVCAPVWRCAALPVSGWSVWRAAAGLQTPEEGSHAWWGGSARAGTFDRLHHPPPEYCSPYCTHTHTHTHTHTQYNLLTMSQKATYAPRTRAESHTRLRTSPLPALRCAAGWWQLRRDKHTEVSTEPDWVWTGHSLSIHVKCLLINTTMWWTHCLWKLSSVYLSFPRRLGRLEALEEVTTHIHQTLREHSLKNTWK